MKSSLPISVSIVVPAFNEEKHIESCINSILNFKGLDKILYEIFIIDGMSTDSTREKVRMYSQINPSIVMIDNPKRIQSSALNIGILNSGCDYIMRLDAHSEYPDDYLEMLIDTALRTDADNTGGLIVTYPGGKNYGSNLVQALTTHKFGVGNSGFRTGAKEGPADTVPFGFFKKVIFDRIGLFDEKLIRCQDYEVNRRITKNQGKIWMNPQIQAKYYNQPGLWKFLKKQILLEAPYNPYMWYLYPYTFAYRHAITGVFTFFFISGLIASFLFVGARFLFLGVMFFYIFLAIFSAVQQTLRYKNILHLIFLPISFFLFHFLHGMGIWIGIIKLILGISPVQKNI